MCEVYMSYVKSGIVEDGIKELAQISDRSRLDIIRFSYGW